MVRQSPKFAMQGNRRSFPISLMKWQKPNLALQRLIIYYMLPPTPQQRIARLKRVSKTCVTLLSRRVLFHGRVFQVALMVRCYFKWYCNRLVRSDFHHQVREAPIRVHELSRRTDEAICKPTHATKEAILKYPVRSIHGIRRLHREIVHTTSILIG